MKVRNVNYIWDLSEIDTLIKQGRLLRYLAIREDKTTSTNVQNIINKYLTLFPLYHFKHMNLLTEARKNKK